MGYYLLHGCAVKKKRVVVLKAGWNINVPHLFCEEGVFTLDNLAFLAELDRPEVLCVQRSILVLRIAPILSIVRRYILDGMNMMTSGLPSAARMLALTSPLLQRYSVIPICSTPNAQN